MCHVTWRVSLSLFASVPHSHFKVSTQVTVGVATARFGQNTVQEPSCKPCPNLVKGKIKNLLSTLLKQTKTTTTSL